MISRKLTYGILLALAAGLSCVGLSQLLMGRRPPASVAPVPAPTQELVVESPPAPAPIQPPPPAPVAAPPTPTRELVVESPPAPAPIQPPPPTPRPLPTPAPAPAKLPTQPPQPQEHAQASIEAQAEVARPLDLAGAMKRGWYRELVVEMRAARLARESIHAFLNAGELLVPAQAVFDLVEVQLVRDDEGNWIGFLEPEHTEIRINPAANRAWFDQEQVPTGEILMPDESEEIYIGQNLIERLLGVQTWFDLAELTLLLDPITHLPLGQRIDREQARDALLAERMEPPPDEISDQDERGLGGATIDWSLQVPSHGNLSMTRYRLECGSALFGGALDLLYRGAADQRYDSAGDNLEASWVAAWPKRKTVRQMRLGTILGTGPRPRSLHGIAFGNTPYLRASHFSPTTLTGWLNPNWEIELYRNGELTDFVRADGRGYFELETPLEYGSNPLEVRAYGPHGEMRVLSQALPVSSDRLPHGKFEYEISGGTCQTGVQDCDLLGNLDLRYGLSKAWTLRAGADGFSRDAAPDLFHPYMVLSGTIADHWTLRAEGIAGALASAQIGHVPSPNFRASASHTVYRTDVEQPILAPAGLISRSWASTFWRPRSRHARCFFSLNGSHMRDDQGWQMRGTLQATAQLGGLRWDAHWRETRTERTTWSRHQSVLGINASTVLHNKGLAILNGLYFRGGAATDVRSGQLDRITLAAGKSMGKGIRLEAGAQWIGPDADARLTLSFTMDGSAFRSLHRAQRSEQGDYQTASFLDGSLVWNSAIRRLEPFPYRSTGRGGLSGTAFIDRNGNGWRDPDEPPVAGLKLRTADKVAETDAQGRYSLWNLAPFDAADVQLVPASLENPLLVPRFTMASIHVMPNGFREINIPMTPGIEVMGRIVDVDATIAPAFGSLPLALRNLTTGRIFETQTFQDGRFYFMALPPGEYEVIIDGAVLEGMGRVLMRSSRYCHVPAAVGMGGMYEFDIEVVDPSHSAYWKDVPQKQTSGPREGFGAARMPDAEGLLVAGTPPVLTEDDVVGEIGQVDRQIGTRPVEVGAPDVDLVEEVSPIVAPLRGPQNEAVRFIRQGNRASLISQPSWAPPQGAFCSGEQVGGENWQEGGGFLPPGDGVFWRLSKLAIRAARAHPKGASGNPARAAHECHPTGLAARRDKRRRRLSCPRQVPRGFCATHD